MTLRKSIRLLLVGAVLLPVWSLVIAAVASLLMQFGDRAAATAAKWAAWIVGTLWFLDLVTLLIAIAVVHLPEVAESSGSLSEDSPGGSEEER